MIGRLWQTKTRQTQKGLSHKRLIDKYESGEVNMDEAVEKMLEKPSKAASKTEKQSKKVG